ncbi:hypothetical protein Adt_32909 [Abeliophyllum distichum]|uniref:Uncharacterized protein n=1 Tax=Abeliophyllum distichum TaxID=126358 RepID=A0ABD1QUQ8_9LAMI
MWTEKQSPEVFTGNLWALIISKSLQNVPLPLGTQPLCGLFMLRTEYCLAAGPFPLGTRPLCSLFMLPKEHRLAVGPLPLGTRPLYSLFMLPTEHRLTVGPLLLETQPLCGLFMLPKECIASLQGLSHLGLGHYAACSCCLRSFTLPTPFNSMYHE